MILPPMLHQMIRARKPPVALTIAPLQRAVDVAALMGGAHVAGDVGFAGEGFDGVTVRVLAVGVEAVGAGVEIFGVPGRGVS